MPALSVNCTPRSHVDPIVPACDSSEYFPDASHSQMSSAVCSIGLPVVASTTFSRSFSGIPGRPMRTFARIFSSAR
jgi:hypothetical protein